METSSILTLDAIDRAIGDFLVGLPVQRPPDRKPARFVISNKLNAANRLAPRPLPNGLQALFSKSPVAHSDCFPLRHAANIYSSLTAISRCAISLIIRFERRFFLTAASGPVKVTRLALASAQATVADEPSPRAGIPSGQNDRFRLPRAMRRRRSIQDLKRERRAAHR